MDIEKILPGIYSAKCSKPPDTLQFIRDDDNLEVLLHVCEWVTDEELSKNLYVLYTDEITWDFQKGQYRCQGCKDVWDTPSKLKEIWADGLGTGYEGIA